MILPSGCMGIPPGKAQLPCAAGVDIRPASWDVAIADVQRNAQSNMVTRLVFYGKLEDEAQVEWVMNQYGVRSAVLDSRPETTLAERLQKKMLKRGVRVWRSSYLTTPGDVKVQEQAAEGILRVERTMTLDDVPYQLKVGGIAIPQNYREICGDGDKLGGAFMRELLNSTRISRKVNGREFWTWVSSGADHAFHALNYLLLAIQVGRLMYYSSEATMGTTSGLSAAPKIVVTDDQLDAMDDVLVWSV